MDQRTNVNLAPEWIVGFTEGEGAFMINVRQWDGKRWRPRFGLQITPYFEVVQNDRTPLDELKDFFGVGAVGDDPAPPWMAYRYSVSNIREILVIRNFFRNQTFHSDKGRAFQLWSTVIDMMLRGEHYKKDGLLQILKIRDSMNKKHPPNYLTYENAKEIIEHHLSLYPENQHYKRTVIWKDLK